MKILMVREQDQWIINIYRGMGTFLRLNKLIPFLQVFEPQYQHLIDQQTEGEPWHDVIGCDMVYFLRTHDVQNLELARFCKRVHIPIWYDVDDDMLNVNEDSRAHWYFNQKETKERIQWFYRCADFVTVCTKHLYEKILFHRDGKPTLIILNALDDYSFPDLIKYPEHKPEKTILWRGGATHQEDLRFHEEAFIGFNARTHDWKLHFWGDKPYRIMKGRPRMEWWPFSRQYFKYMYGIRNLIRPFAVVVPLCENEFNLAKSNIAALEAVYAGAVPIIPKYPEWLPFDGALFYSNVKEMEDAMMAVTEMTETERKTRWEKNIGIMMGKYFLRETNGQREEVIRSLVK